MLNMSPQSHLKPCFKRLEHMLVEQVHELSHGLLAMLKRNASIADDDTDHVRIVYFPAGARRVGTDEPADVLINFFDFDSMVRGHAKDRFEELIHPDQEAYFALVSQVWHAYGGDLSNVADALAVPEGFVALTTNGPGDSKQLERTVLDRSGSKCREILQMPQLSACHVPARQGYSGVPSGWHELYHVAGALQSEIPNHHMHTPSYRLDCGVLDWKLLHRIDATTLIAMSNSINRLSLTQMEPAHTALLFAVQEDAEQAVIRTLLDHGARFDVADSCCPIATALAGRNIGALAVLVVSASSIELTNWWHRRQAWCTELGAEFDQGLSIIRSRLAWHAATSALEGPDLGGMADR